MIITSSVIKEVKAELLSAFVENTDNLSGHPDHKDNNFFTRFIHYALLIIQIKLLITSLAQKLSGADRSARTLSEQRDNGLTDLLDDSHENIIQITHDVLTSQKYFSLSIIPSY